MNFKKYSSIFIVVVCVVCFLYLCPFSFSFSNTDKELKKGKVALTLLSKQDFNAIDNEIRAIQQRYILENNDPSTFAAQLNGTIIMGDSLSAGLLEYGLLPETIVLASRGKRSDNIDEEVQTVINYAPRVVFMQYGINDLTFCRGDAKRFAQQYSEQVKKLKDGLPNTEIYINSLTPVSQYAIDQNPNYGHVDEFNAELKKMCKTLNVHYIDNTKTLNFQEDVYEYDGIHPQYAYYPLWISSMINAAKL